MAAKVKPTEQEVYQATSSVLAAEDTGFNSYAKAYAHAIFDMQMHGEALRVQVLYVLSNLQYWRGYEARGVKQLLRDFTKDS